MPDDPSLHAAPAATAPRKRDRDTRRAQLIEATIETIAARGFARTTLTEVARTAGLSHGLVNFHFTTKEGLLNETLAYLSDEYLQNWTEALAAAGNDPADRLDALIRADFNPAISTPARLAAWCAFWGEAQSRPMYQERYAPDDERYIAILEGICADLIAAGAYTGNARVIARVIRIAIEGTWLDLMTMRDPYTRDEAMETVHTAASAFFPRHFGPRGRIG